LPRPDRPRSPGFIFEEVLEEAEIRRIQMELRRVDPRTLQKNPGSSTYVHPAALFALSQAEIAHHSEAPRDYSWAYRDNDDGSDESGEEAGEVPGALEPEPDDNLDDLDADENAHLGDEDPPIVSKRTRTSRGHAAAAE
jgi:hypothetical protein